MQAHIETLIKHKCLSPSKLMANQVPITCIPPPKNNNKKTIVIYPIFLYLDYNYIYWQQQHSH